VEKIEDIERRDFGELILLQNIKLSSFRKRKIVLETSFGWFERV